MKLIVKNLNLKTRNEDLKKLFTPLGKVKSAEVIYDEFTGKSKRFGFVEMTYDGDAFNAIKELNETTFGTQLIYVSRVIPRRF